jgi:hypothetical protein
MKNLSVFSLLTMLALLAGCAGDTTVSTDHSVVPESAALGETDTETLESVATANRTTANRTTANKNCPIMGHAVTADGGSVAWNGKTIGFCCEGCKPEFEKLSDEGKTTKLAEADKSDHSGHKEGEAEEKPTETTGS